MNDKWVFNIINNPSDFCHIIQLFSSFQIPCATLHEVIDALVEKTAGTLQPFLLEEPYEENISEAHFTSPAFLSFSHHKSISPTILLLLLCHQHMFLPMMKMEKGSSTLPPPAPFQRLLPCRQNKVCLFNMTHIQIITDSHRQTASGCFHTYLWSRLFSLVGIKNNRCLGPWF